MSKFISLVMAPYLALDLYFPITYWLSLLRDSICVEKSTFSRLPTPTFSIRLLFLFYVSIKNTTRNLGFTKSYYFYLVNATILYLLCIPVYSSILPGFLHVSISSPNLRSCSTSIHPEVLICSCDSPMGILSWVPTALGIKIKLLSKPQKWHS